MFAQPHSAAPVSDRPSIRLILACVALATANAASAQQLEGSSWQLVKIQSMDDTVKTPQSSSDYTLAFGADGTVAIQADCNRGAGSWSSASEGMVEFGPITSTRALCPPTSISDDYLAQFQWIRSYVFEDGNLYLATMADGAILEFAPAAAEPTAQVLGTELTQTDETELQAAILGPLFNQYAAQRGIEAEQSEIDRFLETLRTGRDQDAQTDAPDLTEKEAAQLDEMETSMARSMIRQWKINKALHGGRIIYQQLGPEPLDAMRDYLEARQAEGAFEIYDPALAEAFWSYFTDDTRHDFMDPGSADAEAAFSTPFWE